MVIAPGIGLAFSDAKLKRWSLVVESRFQLVVDR